MSARIEKLLEYSAILIILLVLLASTTPITALVMVRGVARLLGRVGVEEIVLVDRDVDGKGNLTLASLVMLAFLKPRKLVLIAHTTNETIVLSEDFNSLIHFPLILSGLASPAMVDDEYRLSVKPLLIKLLGIEAELLEYYTCNPRVLFESINARRRVSLSSSEVSYLINR